MRDIVSPLAGIRSPFAKRLFNVRDLFNLGQGAWYDPSDLTTMFTDTSGTTPATAGDAVARINDKSGDNANASQATTAARPILQQDADGNYYLQNDEVDDALTVTFPNLGSDCTVAYVTASEVFLYEGQTISGAYTLPATDLYNIVIIDRELTLAEKVRLIRYLASKVDGVNYGGDIDRLTLIAINAVDVFVYDTSKDSDGGAWRSGALAQASSWYNETLNTATRGSRRQFPAVAVIVAEAATVTIYDADDPELPMWMVFNTGSGRLLGANASMNSCVAKDGILVLGKTTAGVRTINFVSDASRYYSADAFAGNVIGPIADRNEGTTTISAVAAFQIVNSTVNDVAMTVLPGAPTDPATGLPVPTIAAATVGGVSVITDSGAVWDIISGAAASRNVIFTENDQIWISFDSGSSDVWHLEEVPTSDKTVSSAVTHTPRAVSATGDILGINADKGASISATTLSIGSGTGLNLIAGLGNRLTADSMVAYTTSTYNTGWMNGDIKGAFLSDTSTASLVASDVVTNGGFATDTDWVKGTGWTIASNVASSDGSQTADSDLEQTVTTVAGRQYILRFTVSNRSAGNVAGVIDSTEIIADKAANGSYSGKFTATTTSHTVKIRADLNFVGDIDNVSFSLADADRSVNNNGLIVNGTITRTAVASGADLMAYSGFSAANYLEQPYNSALDFGTGDFCVMGWLKQAANSAVETILERDSAATAQRFTLAVNASGFLTFTCDDNTTARTATSNVIVDTGAWTHFVALYDGAGAVKIYLNGELDDTESGSALLTLNNAAAVLRVGLAVDDAEPLTNGNLALLRISATVPTATQIAKIYEDELPLFQVNARATLYGASDAVTALAHDPDTGLLHVGTSAGRSVFRGLERLSNTTTSVAATISASGGLVVSK